MFRATVEKVRSTDVASLIMVGMDVVDNLLINDNEIKLKRVI